MEWQRLVAGAPPGRWGHSWTAISSRHIVTFAGISGGKIFDDVHVFDAASGAWSSPLTKGAQPSGRWGHTMTLVKDKKLEDGTRKQVLVLFGGREGSKPLPFNETFFLDLDTFEWSRADIDGAAPKNRYGHTSEFLEDSRQLLVFGGHGGRTRYYKDVHLFDVDTHKWTVPSVSGTGPSKRSGHSMTRCGSKLLIFGGFDGSALLDDMFAYDITTSAWTQINVTGTGSLPGMFGHCAVSLPTTEQLIIFGGCYSPSEISSRLYVVDVKFRAFSVAAARSSPSSRFWHRAALIGSEMIVFGGSGSSGNPLGDVCKLNLAELATGPSWEAPTAEMFALHDAGNVSPTMTGTMAIGMGGMGNLATKKTRKDGEEEHGGGKRSMLSGVVELDASSEDERSSTGSRNHQPRRFSRGPGSAGRDSNGPNLTPVGAAGGQWDGSASYGSAGSGPQYPSAAPATTPRGPHGLTAGAPSFTPARGPVFAPAPNRPVYKPVATVAAMPVGGMPSAMPGGMPPAMASGMSSFQALQQENLMLRQQVVELQRDKLTLESAVLNAVALLQRGDRHMDTIGRVHSILSNAMGMGMQ